MHYDLQSLSLSPSRKPLKKGNMHHRIIIGIGTNIDNDANIAKVKPLLEERFQVLQYAKWLQTEPIGIKEQPIYTNGAALIECSLSPEVLKINLKEIEDLCGRDRSGPKFGPRTMDLDILTWNDEVIDQDVFTRDFLQSSITELNPNIQFK